MGWSETSASGEGWYRPAAVAAPYIGPGDLVSGWLAFGGLRAFNAAKAAALANCCQLYDDATAGLFNVPLLSTGAIDLSPLSTGGRSTGDVFEVNKLYDQIGGSNDFVASITPPNGASTLNFTLAQLGSYPAASMFPNFPMALPAGFAGSGQPFVIYLVCRKAHVSGAVLFTNPGFNVFISDPSVNNLLVVAGSSATIPFVDGEWHTLAIRFNDTSSAYSLDQNTTGGAATPASPGANSLPSGAATLGYPGNAPRMDIVEFGIIAGNVTDANLVKLTANAASFYGVAFPV